MSNQQMLLDCLDEFFGEIVIIIRLIAIKATVIDSHERGRISHQLKREPVPITLPDPTSSIIAIASANVVAPTCKAHDNVILMFAQNVLLKLQRRDIGQGMASQEFRN